MNDDAIHSYDTIFMSSFTLLEVRLERLQRPDCMCLEIGDVCVTMIEDELGF